MSVLALGSLGWAVAFAAVVTRLGALRRRGPWLLPLFLASCVVAFLPLPGGLALGGYLRGIGGDPSVTSLVLVGALVVALVGGPDALTRRELLPLTLGSASGAAFLYPMTLGLTLFDPYVLGYQPALWLLAALGIVALASGLAGRALVLISILASVGAWSFGVGESTNLWDYVLDPWLALFAVVWLMRHLRPAPRSPNLTTRARPPVL